MLKPLGVSRRHLGETVRRAPRKRTGYDRDRDRAILDRIREVVRERSSYGYRRVTARLNRQGFEVVNHKRAFTD